MNRTFTQLLLIGLLALQFAFVLQAQTTLAQWNFNGSSATTVPGGTDAPTPATGSGTASLVGGVSATFASGVANGGSTDPVNTNPPNFGWNISTFAAQGTGDKTRGVQFLVSTAGYQNITVRWDQRHSNTAPRHVQFQYTLDGGSTWIDFGAPFVGNAGDTWFNNRSVDLSAIAGADNNAQFGFRIVATFDPASSTAYTASNTSSTYATSGTWRFDMVTVSGAALPLPGVMRITEWMYDGVNGEFVEFTNVGGSPVDMTGWSFDDNSRVPGSFSLSAFGIVQPGESVIITENTAAAFRSAWNLCANVKVIGGLASGNNLGRNDEINLYDAGGNLVDRLTYNDQGAPPVNGPRTQGASAWVTAAALGTNEANLWVLSTVGDSEGSYSSTGGNIGSPGKSTRATVTFNPCPPSAAIRITEWMYQGANGEFVEFTNVGNTPVDMTGWSFDDNSRTPGSTSLSAFGIVAPGESVILTEANAATFRAAWNLCDAVKVIGNLTDNLGRNDEINLYDAGGNLVDRLTYNDEGATPVNGPRTQNASAWVTAAALGNNTANLWVLSTTGDAEGSYASTGGDVGSPGKSTRATVTFVPCPPPRPDMRITEWMYAGGNGEFVEFTNVGSTPIDMTGWSFDDNSRTPGSVDLSAFGTVQPGESVILTEATAAAFRASWNLCDAVKVIGGLSGGNNLGRNDEINLYDAGGFLVDRLTYNDEGAAPVNGPRTQNASGWATAAALGNNLANLWVLSSVGDAENSYTSAHAAIGNPGRSARATVTFDPCASTGSAPTITLDLAATNNYLDAGLTTPPTGSYPVSGVISDPTDPMSLYGLAFTLADADTPVNDLTFSVATSNPAVAPLANIQVTGSGANRVVKITPAGVGFSTVTLTASDGTNNGTFQILYAASAASATPATTRWHTQAADASAAVSAGGDYMFVADDEDQVLRLFHRSESGLPVAGFDFTSMLGLTDLDSGVPREVDIEGSFRVGNRIYWIGSHGNASAGQNRPNRRRLFATDISGSGASATLTYVGRYDNLRQDLVTWGDANGYNFSASVPSPVLPTVPNGFNIEGFTMAPDGATAYIGFRAPLVPLPARNKALIAPIQNFEAWFNNGAPSGSPTIGAPIELDLGGRCIRSIECNANGCIIVAGSTNETPNFKLYTWTGNPADAPRPRSANLGGMTPEALVELPVGNFLGAAGDNLTVQLISDNGTTDFYNSSQEAKDLPNNNHKKFRSDIVTLGPVDLPAPIIVQTAQDLNVECDGTGNSAQLNAWLANRGGAMANVACAPAQWSHEQVGSTTAAYPLCSTYRFTVTDDCGRTAQTQATFCIQDNTLPSITCANLTVTFNGEGSIVLNPAQLVTANDVCGIANIQLSPSLVTCDQIGQNVPVTVIVTDVAGNISTCTSIVTVAGLPCNWSQNPNGVNCNNGSSFSLNAQTGVWTGVSVNCFYGTPYNSDAMAYTQRALCGNGSITTQVISITGGGWAGIIMRESSAPGAKKVQLMTNLSNFHRREVRTVTNGAATIQQFPANNRYWLRIVRQGNQFTGLVSPDGVAWFLVMATTVDMPHCIEVGLVITNLNTNSTAIATFANVVTSGNSNLLAPAGGDEAPVSLDQEVTFQAWPNPSAGLVQVDLRALQGRSARVQLWNATGQMQWQRLLSDTPERLEIDLSPLPGGVYYLRLESEGMRSQTLRLVRTGQNRP